MTKHSLDSSYGFQLMDKDIRRAHRPVEYPIQRNGAADQGGNLGSDLARSLAFEQFPDFVRRQVQPERREMLGFDPAYQPLAVNQNTVAVKDEQAVGSFLGQLSKWLANNRPRSSIRMTPA